MPASCPTPLSLSAMSPVDEQIDAVFAQLKERYGKLDTLVHSVAFAPADELHNDFLLTSREGFRVAHEISVYSLIALSRGAAPLMTDGGSIITMTYYGSQKVVPRYNVMGVAKAALEATVRYLAADLGPKKIRVNAISAGPIKTLAARGIGGLGEMLKVHAERSPLEAQHGARRGRQRCVVPGFGSVLGDKRRGALRGLRLQRDVLQQLGVNTQLDFHGESVTAGPSTPFPPGSLTKAGCPTSRSFFARCGIPPMLTAKSIG